MMFIVINCFLLIFLHKIHAVFILFCMVFLSFHKIVHGMKSAVLLILK